MFQQIEFTFFKYKIDKVIKLNFMISNIYFFKITFEHKCPQVGFHICENWHFWLNFLITLVFYFIFDFLFVFQKVFLLFIILNFVFFMFFLQVFLLFLKFEPFHQIFSQNSSKFASEIDMNNERQNFDWL